MAKAKTTTNGEVALPLEARVAQCINEFSAPNTSQDTVDKSAAEYATATLLRQYAEKRFDRIKSYLVEEHAIDVAKVRNEAVERDTKSTTIVAGAEWALTFSANSPSTRLDPVVFKNELVKAGVNVSIIDKAESKAIKKSTPALVITAKR